jgi:hypothetical protein
VTARVRHTTYLSHPNDLPTLLEPQDWEQLELAEMVGGVVQVLVVHVSAARKRGYETARGD